MMAKEMIMPQMGYDMTEGTLLRWLKNVGDQVERGEPIAEIETDKVTIEIEAFDSGVLKPSRSARRSLRSAKRAKSVRPRRRRPRKKLRPLRLPPR
jgi:predicted deacylase